jgi:hypothetical protein
VQLQGFTPPHPAELAGYRFADTTALQVRFTVDPLFLAANLDFIELKSGDIALLGHGKIDRELASLRLRAELAATLDCVTLARGYANERVGGALGEWGSRNAVKAIRGNVQVHVQLDVDSAQLERARVVKRIGVGCGLRPMTIGEVIDLGLPPWDPQSAGRLIQQQSPDQLLRELNQMPNLLPTFDELDPFGLKRPPTVNQHAKPKSKSPPAATPRGTTPRTTH